MISINRYFYNKLIDKLKLNTLVRCYSVKPAIKKDDEERIQEALKSTERIAHISQKKKLKKPQKEPFTKNIFIGKFDVDILTYPQLEKEELETLNANLKPVSDYFDKDDVLSTKTLTDNLKQSLTNLSLFGMRIPQVYGGRELNVTETCRFNEVISQHKLKRTLMYNEHFCIQCIEKLGSDKLKNKYLPRLLSGNLTSAFCIGERDSLDPGYLKTTATPSHDGVWVLNGKKCWVLNGNTADVFVVIAKSGSVPVETNILQSNLIAFIVEKGFGGVTIEKCPTYNNEIDIANVMFQNTCVPAENIIGIENLGHLVLINVLPELRLSVGPACITLSKKLLNQFTEHCRNSGGLDNSLMETDAVKSKIAEITAALYATESITYLTSNLLDQYEDQDCEMEAAIVKVFASESGFSSSLLCADFLGSPAYLPNHWVNEILQDTLAYCLLNESNDNLKLIIGLLGVRHAGLKLNQIVKEQRNPFFNPAAVVKRLFQQRKQVADRPALNLRLKDYLHPSCTLAADLLEYCVLRLQFATETLLVRQGASVVNAHVDLKRLADCIIDIYTMTACLGRASRSYCIGLRHADFEIALANVFCIKATQRVKQRVKEIFDGDLLNGDENDRVIAKEIIRIGNYFPQHPLSRNF